MKIHFLDPNPLGREAVLLLHGLGADSRSWALQMPSLVEAGYRPVAVDTPGFGGSPYDGRGWNIKRMAAGMAELISELSIPSVNVVGLSMGGVIAQQVAIDYPQLVRKLVLVSTFCVLRPGMLKGWVYYLQRFILLNTLGLRAQAKVVADHVFPGEGKDQLRALLIETIAQADRRAYRAAVTSLGLFDSRKQLAGISVPTLVVTGMEDTTVAPARQRLLVEGIPGARQVLIPAAGHALTIDQPEKFNRELLGFLAST